MRIKVSKYEEVETDLMTVDQMVELRYRLETKMMEMKAALQEAKVRLATAGEHADSDWYARTKAAVYFTAQACQRLQHEQGKRKRLENQMYSRPLSEFFMEICRERMPDDLFEKLYQAAKIRAIVWREEKQHDGAVVDKATPGASDPGTESR